MAEDWYHTFKERATDRAFIEAITIARRKGGGFFPTESDVFEILGINPAINCKKCGYYRKGNCKNIKDVGFDVGKCKSFTTKAQGKEIL